MKRKNDQEYSIEMYWDIVFGKKYSDVVDEHNKCIYNNKPSRVQAAYEYVKERKQLHTQIYTSRVTYIWVIEAIFLGAIGALFNNKEINLLITVIRLLICACGLFVTNIWIETLNASKYCEENAEKHLMMLEEIIMGNIYKTFWIDPHKEHSISTLNLYVCYMFIFIWSLIILYYSYFINYAIFSFIVVCVVINCQYLFCKHRIRKSISEITSFKYVSKHGESPLRSADNEKTTCNLDK